MRILIVCLTLALSASPVAAQDTLGLAAPQAVVKSGLLKYILPRFSLKTSIRVQHDDAGPMRLTTVKPGVPVFHADGTIFYLRVTSDVRQQRFRDWMISEIGKTTIESFRPDTGQPFSARLDETDNTSAPVFDGNAELGAKLSMTHCGRCHVIGPENRMKGLGSTPSFAVLRSLADWDTRFQDFFLRKPHPAFTQIDGVTPPFDPERPSPIFPVQISMDNLDAILAFVSKLQAADLGAPLQSQ